MENKKLYPVSDIKNSLFSQEEQILRDATKKVNDSREMVESMHYSVMDVAGSLELLTKSYKKLLKQIKQLTRLSDSQHRKLLVVQDELNNSLGRADQLLRNILPAEVANELKRTERVVPKGYTATILFSDFIGFTSIATKLSPLEVVERLSESFDVFDELSYFYNMEKIKTIGDAYMCAGGLPKINQSHPIDAVLAALAMRDFIHSKRSNAKTAGKDYWDIRIGIHTGEVAAGIIGTNRFVYDIWGDAVNIASRMESNAPAGCINISKTTYEAVEPFFECSARGEMEVRGLGKMEMFTVHKIRSRLSKKTNSAKPNNTFLKIIEGYRNSRDFTSGALPVEQNEN